MGFLPRLNNSSYLSKSRLFFCNVLKQLPAIRPTIAAHPEIAV